MSAPVIPCPGYSSARPCGRSRLPDPRFGSQLTARKGVIYRVIEALVMVSSKEAESPSLVVQGIVADKSSVLLVTVGIFAKHTRRAKH